MVSKETSITFVRPLVIGSKGLRPRNRGRTICPAMIWTNVAKLAPRVVLRRAPAVVSTVSPCTSPPENAERTGQRKQRQHDNVEYPACARPRDLRGNYQTGQYRHLKFRVSDGSVHLTGVGNKEQEQCQHATQTQRAEVAHSR